MLCHKISILFVLLHIVIITSSEHHANFQKPTVLIGILARNKAHTLPYTLSFLESLNYPKDRISLWIQSDNNIDNTIKVLNTWIDEQGSSYHSINVTLDKKSKGFKNEEGIADWDSSRFEHIILLRERILDQARRMWADFVFMLDADVFLTNPDTLNLLISQEKLVVAPLLKSDGMYSNFWSGMTDNYYYKRTDEYEPILNRENPDCHIVPMIHSAVLIDLRREASKLLTYDSKKISNYDGPRDDIITFALQASYADIPLHVCNNEIYGFIMVPLEKQDKLEHDYQQLINLKLEMLAIDEIESIPISKTMKRFVIYPPKDRLGLDKVFMINLERRPERRSRMLSCFNELGIDHEIIDAVDGRMLNESLLDSWEIKMMPGYKDPFHNRPMTMGEVGCFLSHYIAWNKVIESGYRYSMVLEDDVKFEPYFKQKVLYILQELETVKKDWDLVYLGRKRLQKDPENWVEGSQYLVHAGYSYWTVGYLLSAKGAKKLINSKPLQNLIPVDEFLPIMYDKHTREEWKQFFPERNLVALSAEPLVIYPTHYTGDAGYISDTENSSQLPENSRGDNGSKEEL
ncbi:glycosyltransferase 25 family member [Trichogramma pretiosum]|uniref:glycosyltransferase 25 family member n=1 Tax=Trichogramma pretiosum TaxID=7493 RepID=UPI0006C9E49B|nr:glycosyltransferase 25 family member [Trichogramma pretiosum]